MGEIGLRAAEQLRKMAHENGVSLRFEAICLGTSQSNFDMWKKGSCDPGAKILANMLESGYDIEYILLGKEKQNA